MASNYSDNQVSQRQAQPDKITDMTEYESKQELTDEQRLI